MHASRSKSPQLFERSRMQAGARQLQFRKGAADGNGRRGSRSVESAAGKAQLAWHRAAAAAEEPTAAKRVFYEAEPSNKQPIRCRLTLRSSGPPPAERPGREASSGIIRFAARVPCRRCPLSSNVRRHLELSLPAKRAARFWKSALRTTTPNTRLAMKASTQVQYSARRQMHGVPVRQAWRGRQGDRGSQSVVSAARKAQLAFRQLGSGGGRLLTAANQAFSEAKPSNKFNPGCRLTLRSSGRPPASPLGREPASVIIGLAAQGPSRRPPLSSNVRHQRPFPLLLQKND
jgi:hypothetical protein